MSDYKNSKQDTEEKKVSEWGRCEASGCSIRPSVKAGGHTLCTFHAFKEFDDFEAITKAINNNIEHYNYINTLLRWNNEKWNKQWRVLLNYTFCPIIEGEHELPHRYIERLSQHLRATIKREARL